MNPETIILIRHGQSLGNVDGVIYKNTPNHRVPLTQKGIEQSIQSGKDLGKIIGNGKLQIYSSPYLRTRDTLNKIVSEIPCSIETMIREDPRIREHERPHYYEPDQFVLMEKERDRFGKFYYRNKGGESGADVYDRISCFIESLHREFNYNDFPENVLIVTHGLALRIFLMSWFQWSVEFFDKLPDPGNCQYVVLRHHRIENKFAYKIDYESSTYGLPRS